MILRLRTLCTLLLIGPTLAMTADDIMTRVDQTETPTSQRADMTMILLDNRGNQRVRSIQSQRAEIDGVERSLMFFIEPADVRGTGFLMFDYEDADRDDDQWMLLPSLGKAKRIASSDKTGSFMGSDFSYADMSQRNLSEWTYTLLKEDSLNGVDVWVIESIPVSQDVIDKTGYVRSIIYVRQDTYQVTRGISYLEKSGEVKLMNVSEFTEIDGYSLATETQMVTQKNGKTVHRTLMKLDIQAVDFDFDPDNFTLNRLEQGL